MLVQPGLRCSYSLSACFTMSVSICCHHDFAEMLHILHCCYVLLVGESCPEFHYPYGHMAGTRLRQQSTSEEILDCLTHEHRILLLRIRTSNPASAVFIELNRLRIVQDTDHLVGNYLAADVPATLPPASSSPLFFLPLLLLLLLLLPPLSSSSSSSPFSSSSASSNDEFSCNDSDEYQTLPPPTQTSFESDDR